MSEQDGADADGSPDQESTDADPADPAEPGAGSSDEESGSGEPSPSGSSQEETVDDGSATDSPTDGDEEPIDSSTDVDEVLVERVAESDPEEIAREIASLRTRVEGLEGRLADKEEDVEELTSKLKRKQADFENYKKRMKRRREDEKRRAAADLVTRLLDVRDNLVRALEQDEDAEIRGGVESTLRQFDDVLAAENVETVEPEPGAEVDPGHHQVLARVESDQPEGTIADVHRPGYVMADSVLREAQVTVSEGSEADGDDDGGSDADGDGDGGGDADAPDGGSG